jgi:hypothetical protein
MSHWSLGPSLFFLFGVIGLWVYWIWRFAHDSALERQRQRQWRDDELRRYREDVRRWRSSPGGCRGGWLDDPSVPDEPDEKGC